MTEQDLKQQIVNLKIQIGLLQNEVAKWKRAHYYANKDLARMEAVEGKRIEAAQMEEEAKRDPS